jgi:hypothetical protein
VGSDCLLEAFCLLGIRMGYWFGDSQAVHVLVVAVDCI